MNENYDLGIERFYTAHQMDYDVALSEIKREKKLLHWMWYIFPQLRIYARSSKAVLFGISGREEAMAFYRDEYLGSNLREICAALLECKSDDAFEIFGSPDNMKLMSSMTLFYLVTGDELFKKVLDKFFDGRMDEGTEEFLKRD